MQTPAVYAGEQEVRHVKKRIVAIDPAAAERLRQRREALGLSQNDLALAIGASESMISKYETLRTPIPPRAAAALDEVLAQAEAAGARAPR